MYGLIVLLMILIAVIGYIFVERKIAKDRKEKEEKKRIEFAKQDEERRIKKRRELESTSEGREHLANCTEKRIHKYEKISEETVEEGGRYEIDSHGDGDWAGYGYAKIIYRCVYCDDEKCECEKYDNRNDDVYQIYDEPYYEN